MSNQYATSLRHIFNTAQDALNICETCIRLASKMEKEIVKRDRRRDSASSFKYSSTKGSRFLMEDDDDHTTVDYSLSAASYYTQQLTGASGKQESALSILTQLVAAQSDSATMIGIVYS